MSLLAPLLLAALLPQPVAAPQDAEYRAALERLYEGGTDAALERLAALSAAHSQDPIGPYLEALALCWKLEQRPDTRVFDKELHRRADRAIALADARLRTNPEDVRAWLARGAAHGVRSRLHLQRLERGPAARAAVAMRADLLNVLRLDPDDKDARFGLGLYDYYADVLPKLVKVVRFFMGIPGGNRERGLAEIEAALQGSRFHATEARAQLYAIHAYYEREPDRALTLIQELRARYPEAPLWGLRLAEHLRERLGLYARSAAVAGELLAASERGQPNHAPVVGAMARLALGEALLSDLRLPEARRALLPLKDGAPEAPWIGPRARLALGRSLELEGDRDGALVHYRLAAQSLDRELRGDAERAQRAPLGAARVRALQHLAEARRLREADRPEAAEAAAQEALLLDPRCEEAELLRAEHDLRAGRVERARDTARRLAGRRELRPPWLLAWARLLLAEAEEALGQRPEAVQRYKEVFEEPLGHEELRQRAAEGLRRLAPPRDSPPPRSNHSK